MGETFRPTLSKTIIFFDDHNKYIGLKIFKKEATSTCISVEDYTTKRGEVVKLLIWDVVFKSGNVSKRKTCLPLRVGDLPSKEKNVR